MDRDNASHAPKPLPIMVGAGGYSKRGIVPDDCFDRTTLEEAIAIINGTSTFFAFSNRQNADGKLNLKRVGNEEGDPFRDYYYRNEQRLRMRPLLKNGTLALRALEKKKTAAETKVGAARATIDALQLERRTLLESAVDADAMDQGLTPMDVQRKIDEKKKDPRNDAIEKKLENAKRELEKKKSDARRAEKSFDTMQRDLTVTDDFKNYAKLKAAFLAQADAGGGGIEFSSLYHRLCKAAVLYDERAYRAERTALDSAAKKHNLKLVTSDDHKNLSLASTQVIRATLAILANTALRTVPADPAEVLRQHLTLTAFSERWDENPVNTARAQKLLDKIDGTSSNVGSPDEWLKDDLDSIGAKLDRLREIEEGVEPEPFHFPSKEQYDSWRTYRDPKYESARKEAEKAHKDAWDPEALTRDAINQATWFLRDLNSPEDLMRFHNTHPRETSFVLASKEVAFLRKVDHTGQKIGDIQNFVNSDFMNIVGDIQCAASPQILGQAREMLKQRPPHQHETQVG